MESTKQSRNLEVAILGICILEKTGFSRTYGLIDEDKFYIKDHQHIYRTMRQMYDVSVPIDSITLTLKMLEDDVRLQVGETAWYLSTLTSSVVDTINLEYYCFLLKELWQKREIERLTRSGIDLTEDVRTQGYQINEQINKILDAGRRKEWHSMDELMFNLMIHQQKIKEGKVEFLTTGFKAIDKLNGGFSPGQMIVIGARPSVGKSALMAKIATSIAAQKKTVGIISLEMNNNEIAARLASLETDIEFWRIYRNLFTDESQHEAFYNKVSKHSINLPIYISDKTKVDINEIKAKAAKLKFQHGLDMLMIDYLQLVESTDSNKNYNREQEVSKISRGVKLLAMELQIPVIILCQLNRQVVARKGKERFPQLSDLRESGAIEQDCDIAMMLHRDWMAGIEANENGFSTELEADLIGVKWRNGALFHLNLDFSPEKMKFSEKGEYMPKGNWTPMEKD